jgi:hypothetical protein
MGGGAGDSLDLGVEDHEWVQVVEGADGTVEDEGGEEQPEVATILTQGGRWPATPTVKSHNLRTKPIMRERRRGE